MAKTKENMTRFTIKHFGELCSKYEYNPAEFLIVRRREIAERIEQLEADLLVGQAGGPTEQHLPKIAKLLDGERKDAAEIDLKLMEYLYPKQRAVDSKLTASGEAIKLIINK